MTLAYESRIEGKRPQTQWRYNSGDSHSYVLIIVTDKAPRRARIEVWRGTRTAAIDYAPFRNNPEELAQEYLSPHLTN